jgi:hypothetical protein
MEKMQAENAGRTVFLCGKEFIKLKRRNRNYISANVYKIKII